MGISAFLLRSFGWRGAPVFASIAAVMFIAEAEEEFLYIFGSIKNIGRDSGLTDVLESAIKVLGLGYLYGICADICRDLGEGGIARAAEVVGRVEIIAVVIPYFEEIINFGVDLIG